MKLLTAIMVPASKGSRRLLPTLALTWLSIFLLCLNSYADDAETLGEAAWRGDVSAVKALLAKGADVTAELTDGSTALSLAKQKKHSEIVQLLIKARAKK